jgi:hypothetical protein
MLRVVVDFRDDVIGVIDVIGIIEVIDVHDEGKGESEDIFSKLPESPANAIKYTGGSLESAPLISKFKKQFTINQFF